MTAETHAERLGRLVRARRKRLQMHTAADLAAAAQVSTRLVGDLETGRRSNFSQSNKAALEEVLRWEYGSIDDTLGGGEPTEKSADHEGTATRPHPRFPRDVSRDAAMSYDIIFGQAATRNRERAGLDIAAAARLADLPEARWVNIESGWPDPIQSSEVIAIALALNWDTYEALTLAGYHGLGQGADDGTDDTGSLDTEILTEAVLAEQSRYEAVKAGFIRSRQISTSAMVNFLEMAMLAADVIEHPAPIEDRRQIAEQLRDAVRIITVEYLIQLEPAGETRDLVKRATALLTPEHQRHADDYREKFRRITTFLAGPRDDEDANVTSLADRRRPVPPPPDIDALDVAASRREKLSDGERDDEDGPHELSLSDKRSRRKIKYEFNSSAEAYEYAREFLIAEGEKPHLVDAALGDAGRHIADTSARGWAVRVRKIAGRAAASHEDE